MSSFHILKKRYIHPSFIRTNFMYFVKPVDSEHSSKRMMQIQLLNKYNGNFRQPLGKALILRILLKRTVAERFLKLFSYDQLKVL